MKFTGTYTALVTPFRGGVVDAAAMGELIERQVSAGVDGIVPVGTTGESPTLSHEEHIKVVELSVRRADKRCKVLAGTGSNSTREAISLTHAAERSGADGALLVCPYYNKPPQEGLYRHFAAIAEATDLPLVLYSIPGRCVIEIAADTVARLARDCPNIVAIKEAGGKVERVAQLKAACPEGFTILSGDDAMTVPFMREGASGVISVASNLVPAEVARLVRLERDGHRAEADALNSMLAPLFRDLFLETNPIPIKAAMAMKGWIGEDLRLPLIPMSAENRSRLEATLRAGGWL
ncbi:MAG: 4-hydroxy-tetrahydrodipicolinate synthase [Verrucomicrobiae bacterium]|nr:4-hydroxy-tetrahydrodipicolinate synthase [Verrucomicrobiae bacterium]